ncbi:SRPBCC family protein [Herpetosiphon sp. NSE202]|uniref:SRPBCC family protein n=1 Tax=Herpetosiphon sp. NSE202 TaxID=3351349 RepID=UPI003635C848
MPTLVNKHSAVITLPTDTQIQISRDFNVPKELVYRAWTTPELVKRWWSAGHGTVTIADIDLKIGGMWRWVTVTDTGFEVAFHGEYRELIPNQRLVCTEVYEAMPEGEALNSLSFSDREGGSSLTLLVQHSCQEHRDAHVNSGMESGMQSALAMLEAIALELLEQAAVEA